MRAAEPFDNEADAKVVSIAEPAYAPDRSPEQKRRSRELADEDPDASIVAIPVHFLHWLVLIVVLGSLVGGAKWAQRPDEGPVVAAPSAAVEASTVPGSANESTADATPTPFAASEAQPPAERPSSQRAAIVASPGVATTWDPAAANGGGSKFVVFSVPPGAALSVDGHSLDAVTPAVVTLNEGARLRLEAAGFEPLEWRHTAAEAERLSGESAALIGGGAPAATLRVSDTDTIEVPPLRFEMTPRPLAVEAVRAPADVPYPAKTVSFDPVVPKSATAKQGVVILALLIDTGGNVVGVEVLRGVDPLLDGAAIDAAWRWKFEPTVADGRAVPVTANFSVPFMRD